MFDHIALFYCDVIRTCLIIDYSTQLSKSLFRNPQISGRLKVDAPHIKSLALTAVFVNSGNQKLYARSKKCVFIG